MRALFFPHVLLLWLVLPQGAAVEAALDAYTLLDQIGVWVIERKLTADGQPQCRALIPSGGSWFGANVHLNTDGEVTIPDGLTYQVNVQLQNAVLNALARCRSDLLYLP